MDIEELTNHFLKLFADKTNKKITGITKTCLEALKRHSWKGNIRELKNVIERSVILSENNEIDNEVLPAEFQQHEILLTNAKQLSAFDLASVEKLHIQKVLNYTNGNKTKAAELLNIALTTLYRKLDDYKMG